LPSFPSQQAPPQQPTTPATCGGKYFHVEMGHHNSMEYGICCFSVFLTRAQLLAVRTARAPWNEEVETLDGPFDLTDAFATVSAEDASEAEHTLGRWAVNRNNVGRNEAMLRGHIHALRLGDLESAEIPILDAANMTPDQQADKMEHALDTLLQYNSSLSQAQATTEAATGATSTHGEHLFRVNKHVSGKYMGVILYSVGGTTVGVLTPFHLLTSYQHTVETLLLPHTALILEFSQLVQRHESQLPERGLDQLDNAMITAQMPECVPINDVCVTNTSTGTSLAQLSGYDDVDQAFFQQCTHAAAMLQRSQDRERRVLPMPCLQPETLPAMAPYPIAAQRVMLRHSSGKAVVYSRQFRRLTWYFRHNERPRGGSGSDGGSGAMLNTARPETSLATLESTVQEYFEDKMKFPILN